MNSNSEVLTTRLSLGLRVQTTHHYTDLYCNCRR